MSKPANSRREPRRDPKHAPRAPRVPFALLVVGLLVGGLALLLALNTFSAANELQRNGLADKDAVVAAEAEDLHNQVAASAASQNIAAAAAALGMVHADHPAFLVIGADGKVRVLGKPKPVEAVPVAVPAQRSQAKKSAKPTSSTSAKPTDHRSASRSSAKSAAKSTSRSPSKSPGKSPAKPSGTPKPTPKPTPTPTPVVTLSVGAR